MPSVGFEPTVSAGERPQTYAIDRAVNGTSLLVDFFSPWRYNPHWGLYFTAL